MSQPGRETSSEAALPSSSASSRRDGSDLTVPATPPIAHARADAGAASTTRNITNLVSGCSDVSIMAKASSSSALDHSATALPPSTPHVSSQTIPDSQESASADMQHNGGADSNGQRDVQMTGRSNIASAKDPLDHQDAAASSRKRTASGQVKIRSRSNSPIKGHARSISAISTTSNGSHIGDISADLKTRLSYAMLKVNNGWQSRSFPEIESLASQAASPVSSNSTLHRRQSSSTSPRPLPSAAQVHFAADPVEPRRKSRSPPEPSSKPSLAPPAPIQPSLSRETSQNRRRRFSRHPPALLTHSHSATAASSYSPRQYLDAYAMSSSQPSRPPEGMLYSPPQNMKEQAAIETLLFMSSPNNSANLRHTFSPSVSPGPGQGPLHENASRHTSSGGFRKGLPGQRPALPQRRVGFDKSPAMGPPGSPMDLDSLQQQQSQHMSPNGWSPKRRANGVSGHLRGALSLPSGLGLSNGRARQVLRDEDIERILDHAAADSSDDDGDIKLPPRTNGVAGAVGI
ncbi:cyclin-dependent kinase [Cordyceps fumosorosea ARSEF 2679]|uniref:Cyclin-dependent kinase n=1 Tax=Cordyceps fumosorosea (strain ARSEF 2679) TaxID=1081104 RepID=A0A168B7B8_CORFA|nr:cyclin-dependent kinase [Cordyceps fumosorosea ARSEF 2679]OAA69723.1 cyclin-dependent kinase [Cordyceps fumosorosea ARSEF 2679]